MSSVIVYNDTYSPSLVVKQIHHIPHLDSHLQDQSHDFDVSVDSTWNDYTRSLLPMPIICMTLAILSLFVFEIYRCCMCCSCCKGKLDPLINGGRTPGSNMLIYCRITVFILVLMVLSYDQSIFFGSAFISDGVSKADDALTYLYNTFSALNSYGGDLTSEGYVLQDDLTGAASNGCSQASGLSSYIDQYFSYVDDYMSYVQDVPDKCNNAQDSLDQYGNNYKTSSIWAFYAVFAVCLAIFTFSICATNKTAAWGGFCFSDLVLWFTFVLCGVEMFILMILSDFCMSPTDNLLMIVPDSVSNITTYYSTCYGENPLQPSLTSAQELIDQAQQQTMLLYQTACYHNSYLGDALRQYDIIDGILANISTLIGCQVNQQQVQSVLNQGVCDDAFKGIYTIWLAQFACGAGIFIIAVIVACAYPYYDPDYKEHDDMLEQFGSAPQSPDATVNTGNRADLNYDHDIVYATDSLRNTEMSAGASNRAEMSGSGRSSAYAAPSEADNSKIATEIEAVSVPWATAEVIPDP